MSPRASIIVPAHGRTALLLETLATVVAQEGDFDKEIIVVDDASPEPIEPEVTRRFPGVRVIRHPVNRYLAAARNTGLDAASGDYIAMLDSDDLWSPRFLAETVAAINRDGHPAAVAFSQPLFSENFPSGQRLRVRFLCFVRDSFQRLLYLFNRRALPRSAFYLCQLSHVLFKADAIRDMRFETKFTAGEDWHFLMRFGARGAIGIVPRPLVKYRYHRSQMSADPEALEAAWGHIRTVMGEARQAGVRGFMFELFKIYVALASWFDRRIGRW